MAPDDTVRQAPREPSSPRIRASRPSVSPDSPSYGELLVVDPDHYVVIREIARGGMGRVLLARDRRLGRDVAVKEVIADSPTIERRFEREARITARLQHPSIISVHEAGRWPSREPFYVMPLVTGRSMDDVIGEANTPASRLALLPNVLAVADAMAYAHGQRVIHRDLKPRNIVIGEFGETVVLDWGLAKDLDSTDSMDRIRPITAGGTPVPGASDSAVGETTAGEVLGTPQYMPPEQANGMPVDPRADVYSIGAILYHVLSGRPPFVANSTVELLASVASEPPQPLRKLVPDVASELVAIVDRAMARDVAERYPTAKELADDLRRFQTGQLVGAHRYSPGQLVRRWMRRHRTALVALAAAAIVAIVIGVIAIRRIVAAEEVAQQERTAAQARQKDAEELMQFMLVDLEQKLTPVGKLDLLDTVARRASTYYDARGDTGSDEDMYLSAIARVGVGKVIGSRGDLRGAAAEYDKAIATLDRLSTLHPDVGKYAQKAIDAGMHRAEVQGEQGDLAGMLAAYRAMLTRAQRFVDANPKDTLALHQAGQLHARIGAGLEEQGDIDAALVEFRAELQIANKRVEIGGDTARNVDKDLLNAHAHVGRMLGRKNDLAGELAEYRLGLDIGERHVAKESHDPQWLQDAAISHDEVGQVLQRKKDLTAALAEYRAGKALAERAFAIDHTNTDNASTVATITEKVGIVLFAQKDYDGAAAEFRTCDQMWSELASRDPSNTQWARGQSIIDNKLGDVRLAAKDPAGAIATYQKALAVREQLVAKDPTNASWQRDLFYSHYKLATAYKEVPDHAKRVEELRAATAIAQEALAGHPNNLSSAQDVVQIEAELGDELKAAHESGYEDAYRAGIEVARRMAAQPGADPDWNKLADQLDKALAK